MARVTRLELAASGVTGRRSNQLSYTRMVWRGLYKGWFTLARAFLQKKDGPEIRLSNIAGQPRCADVCKAKNRRVGEGVKVMSKAGKQKKRQRKIATLILYVIPNQGGNGASDET